MNGLLKGLKVEETAQMYKRGEIYYINNGSGGQVGSEMRKDRPAIIVSNDANNKYSSVVEVVYLTSKPKKELPTHVTIRSTGRMSVALCEEPTAISTERINNYICMATDKEMESVDIALMIALGINMTKEMQQSMEDVLTGKTASGGGTASEAAGSSGNTSDEGTEAGRQSGTAEGADGARHIQEAV